MILKSILIFWFVVDFLGVTKTAFDKGVEFGPYFFVLVLYTALITLTVFA